MTDAERKELEIFRSRCMKLDGEDTMTEKEEERLFYLLAKEDEDK